MIDIELNENYCPWWDHESWHEDLNMNVAFSLITLELKIGRTPRNCWKPHTGRRDVCNKAWYAPYLWDHHIMVQKLSHPPRWWDNNFEPRGEEPVYVRILKMYSMNISLWSCLAKCQLETSRSLEDFEEVEVSSTLWLDSVLVCKHSLSFAETLKAHTFTTFHGLHQSLQLCDHGLAIADVRTICWFRVWTSRRSASLLIANYPIGATLVL